MAKSRKKNQTKTPTRPLSRRHKITSQKIKKTSTITKRETPSRRKAANYLARNKNRGYKLEPKDQTFVCSLIAVGYSAPVIADMLSEQRGINVSPKNILSNYKYNRRWRKVIARMRRYMERQVMRHPLASKYNRLDMRLRAIHEAFMPRCVKINYEPFTGKIKSKVIRRNVHLVEALLQGAQEEFDGKKPLIEQHAHMTHIYLPEVNTPNADTGKAGNQRMASPA